MNKKMKSGVFKNKLLVCMVMMFIFMTMQTNIMTSLSTKLSYNLIMLKNMSFEFDFLFDPFSVSFIFILTLISLNVLVYSFYYMLEDVNKLFYYMMFNLFIVSMIFMVITPSMVILILGWDGLGLTSFLLIMFYQNHSSMMKATMTLSINRIGDVMIILSMFFLSPNNIDMISNINMSTALNPILITAFNMTLLAAFVKSAQLPWSGWLLAAMAAPTPISSLVHSSTLVCAGVILTLRVLEWTNEEMGVGAAMWLLAASLFISSLSAWKEKDIKKIIALSTMNQMSLLLILAVNKLFYLCLTHLMSHAIFKSNLFMSAGSVFHSNMNSQETRMNPINSSKLTSQSSFLSSWSLMAFPCSMGFFSKEHSLMESSSMFYHNSYFLMWAMIFLSMFLTVGYSFRILKSMNFEESSPISKFMDTHYNWSLSIPLMILGVGSIIMFNLINIFSSSWEMFMWNPMSNYFVIFAPMISGFLSAMFVEGCLPRQMLPMEILKSLFPNLMGFSILCLSFFSLKSMMNMGWKILWGWEMGISGFLSAMFVEGDILKSSTNIADSNPMSLGNSDFSISILFVIVLMLTMTWNLL
uniref:NADH-ubiquinone oxidoreductase chain 5 n=1 Tax=Gordionus alpestris TaxID=1137640 RepID=A0A514ABY3_9BILA|nr:NADH dehydrogenase subunit 5 [Gordionus alpestris]QDH52419.1 NADH dehydrogenase subunit 5 [Gordionus alpestris]